MELSAWLQPARPSDPSTPIPLQWWGDRISVLTRGKFHLTFLIKATPWNVGFRQVPSTCFWLRSTTFKFTTSHSLIQWCLYDWEISWTGLRCRRNHLLNVIVGQNLSLLPHPLLMNVVAIPVLPDRPVRPILWTIKQADKKCTEMNSHSKSKTNQPGCSLHNRLPSLSVSYEMINSSSTAVCYAFCNPGGGLFIHYLKFSP